MPRFFYPPGRLASAASYNAVRSVDRQTQAVFAAIRHLKADSPASIVEYRGVVTWRHLSYYFPEDPVLYLATNPSEFSWMLLRRLLLKPNNRLSSFPDRDASF